ncbi:hypothetical protein [Olleya marilimosa]|uniref:hypothetical protein n=1 Tax=Olleya marilimosa TaxID=272164 RepID=UPI0030EB9815|tara:strand:+ start:203 stop:2419 length:2217 start_codon:yes stop_codon:yes gene_type:complete
MINYLGHKVDLVDSKVLKNRNAQKSWVYGYDKEYDIVIISKDGTIEDIYHVNGINIALPKPPTDRKSFINWGKTSKNQKWKRKELPKGLNKDTQYDKQYEDYILNEIHRRKYGVWINIKGQQVYLPGLAYYFYQWCYLDEGYPDFRIIQNELIIFWEACKADPRSYGVCYVKNRRFGWSTICDAELLYSGTQSTNKKLGIVSKTNEDAKEMFDIALHMFKKLPPFFQPQWDDKTLSRIIMREDRKGNADLDEGLDTYIRYYSTAINSMDGGKKVFRSAVDEAGKFPKQVPFARYWKIIKTSHRQGTRIVGKSMVGSTVNALKDGGSEFKNVFEGSNPYERNANGQTASGLYSLFISAEYGLEGRYDTYGFSIVENPKKSTLTDEGIYVDTGSRVYLENELDALSNDPDGYNEQLRQFPRTPKEAFRDSSDECEFNLTKLLDQIDHNEKEEDYNEIGANNIERGNFMWKDGMQDTEVIWCPDLQNGRFWLRSGCHPPEEYRSKKEMKYQYGIKAWAPLAEHVGALGADPYNRDKGADGKGSKGDIHGSTKANTWENFPNNDFFLEYIDRPTRVKLYFEDVIMACVYFSMPFLGELSNEAFLQYVVDRGYRHFSLNNPFKAYKDLSPTEKKLGGAPPQGNLVADGQMYAVQTYVEDHVGVSTSDRVRQLGTMGSMPFNRTLVQFKDVDLKHRTKFDAYIGASLSLVANQKRKIKKKEDREPFRNPFTKYDNSGMRSSIAS